MIQSKTLPWWTAASGNAMLIATFSGRVFTVFICLSVKGLHQRRHGNMGKQWNVAILVLCLHP